MSDKIEINDVFGSSFQSDGEKLIASITEAFKKLEAQQLQNVDAMRKLLEGLKVGGSFKDLQTLLETFQRLEKALNDYKAAGQAAAQGERELEKLAQERLKTAQQEEKLKQQQIRTEQAMNKTKEKTLTLYQQESKLLNDLRNKYKDVALAQGANSKAAQDLLRQITPLDAKLKAIDANVGQFQRNVGNYKSGLIEFGGAVRNILGAAGIGLGLSEGFTFLKESIGEFTKSEKVVKDLGFALKNLQGEGGAALDRLNTQAEDLEATFGLFESEDISILQKQLVQLGLNSKDVEKLTPKIIDLAAATGKSLPEATDIAIKAINGQTKGLKEVGLNFDDTGSRLDNYNILLGKLDKFQGAAAQSADTLQGKQTRVAIAWGNIKEAVGEYLTTVASDLLDGFDLLSGKLSETDLQLKALQSTFEESAKSIAAKGPEFTKLALRDLEKQREILKIARDEGRIDNQKYLDELKFISARQKALIAEIDKNGEKLRKTRDSFAGNDSTGKDTAEKVKKEKADNSQSEFIKYELDALSGLYGEAEQLQAKQELTTKVLLGTATPEELKAYNDYYKKEYEERKRVNDEFIKYELDALEGKYGEAEKIIARQELEAKIALGTASLEEIKAYNELIQKEKDDQAKKEKDRKEKQLKEISDFAQKAISIAEQQIKKEQEIKDKALDDEISRRQSAVDYQRERAIAGLDNQLAFEEQALREAEARKAELQKKEAKRQKELTFLELLAANIGTSANPAEALGKTIAEFAAATAVAGSFFVGTEKVEESLKGNKVHSGKDGYVIAVDGKERILTGEQNERVGMLSNEELASLAHDYNMGRLLPTEAINYALPVKTSSPGEFHPAYMQEFRTMNQRLGAVESAINNQPIPSIELNHLFELIKTVTANGLKKTTKFPYGKL